MSSSSTATATTTTTSPWIVAKSVVPKLVPFFKSVAVFFVLFPLNTTPSLLCLITKCAPIFCLCLFVLMHGLSRDFKYFYSRRICLGLLFSMLGDACLIFHQQLFFLAGMCSFGIAHVIYFTAFGIKPFNFRLALGLVTLAVPVCAVYLPFLTSHVLKVGVPVYIALLFLMLWRAVSRLQQQRQNWTWTNMCCSLGALCFVVSDSVLSFDLFVARVPYSHPIVMLTYYAAQLGITLSIVNTYDERYCREVNDKVLQREDFMRVVRMIVSEVKRHRTGQQQQQQRRRVFLKKSASFIVVDNSKCSNIGNNSKSFDDLH